MGSRGPSSKGRARRMARSPCRTSLKRSTRTRPQGATRITLTAALPDPLAGKTKRPSRMRQPRDITGNVQLYKPWRELGPASVESALSRICGGGQGSARRRALGKCENTAPLEFCRLIRCRLAKPCSKFLEIMRPKNVNVCGHEPLNVLIRNDALQQRCGSDK